MSRVLPSKDASNFRGALKLYEQKQYKKALKGIETVLKKHPEHGESLALKGLLLYHLNKKEEGLETIKKGVDNDPSSHVVWHIFGLYHRQEKNYEESAKCYAKSAAIEPDNLNVLRDLSILQMYCQQYAPLVRIRAKLLADKPGFRQNWTSLAIAHHLNKEYKEAEDTLNKFETLLKEPLPKSDVENSELMLYRNRIIYDSGDVQRALDDINNIQDKVLDVLAVCETRAKYLLELKEYKLAQREFRMLIKRNPECNAYYQGLESAMQLDPSNIKLRKVLYERMQVKYPSADQPRAIPLQFLNGAEFKAALHKYLSGYLNKRAPSVFMLIKKFYNDSSKRAIIDEVVEELVSKVDGATTANGSANGATTTNGVDNSSLWTLYFAAQHYSQMGNDSKALETIDECVKRAPEIVEMHMSRAKIFKHMGDVQTAADVMEAARKLDLSDRFVNTKAAKYQLRADRMDEAITTVSMFTRNDKNGKGIQDLHDMQGTFFLVEQAEAYRRMGNNGLALKRFKAVFQILRDLKTDEFDFHYYCPRKGTIKHYFEMIDWAGHLYENPMYERAVAGAVSIYLGLAHRRKQFTSEDDEYIAEHDDLAAKLEGIMDAEEKKKAIKKYKKERAKVIKKEAEEREKDDSKDPDLLGKELLHTKTPLEDAYEVWQPLASLATYHSSRPWELGFELYLAQKKYVLAVQAITKAKNAGASPFWVRSSASRAKHAVDVDEDIPAPVRSVQKMMLPKIVAEYEMGDINTQSAIEYCDQHVFDEAQGGASILHWAKARWEMTKKADRPAVVYNKVEQQVASNTTISLEVAEQLYWFMKERHADVTKFRTDAKSRWPQGTVFDL